MLKLQIITPTSRSCPWDFASGEQLKFNSCNCCDSGKSAISATAPNDKELVQGFQICCLFIFKDFMIQT
jgi:hypothetical protein